MMETCCENEFQSLNHPAPSAKALGRNARPPSSQRARTSQRKGDRRVEPQIFVNIPDGW